MPAFTELFPTSRPLAIRLLEGIDFDAAQTVLEPSAGKGDLATVIAERVAIGRRSYRYDDDDAEGRGKAAIDCIEIEPELRATLKGLGFRVVHDDFLTYHTAKSYDLIVANPPFADGARHLLKMLELARYGGIVRCLLNAETLKNPFTYERKTLCKKLAELGAEIVYLPGEFESAERKTSVEVALVKVTIADSLPDSIIVEELKAAQRAEEIRAAEPETLVSGDFVRAIVARYCFEVDVGVRLIREYNAVLPHLLDSIGGQYAKPILELKIDDRKASGPVLNEYVRFTRLKYWAALFQSREFTVRLTSNLQKALSAKVESLGDYEFSVVNILSIQADMTAQTITGIEDTILKLFDELSHQHSWFPESAKNVHYYNGWATNKAWKINEKVILPMHARGYDGLDLWKVGEWLADIERCLGFLAGDKRPTIALTQALEATKARGSFGIDCECEHFRVKFFKKGTAHITFKDAKLLARFNIFGSQRKKWLPQNYGRAKYADLTDAERTVVDSFEGKESYSKVVAEPETYLLDTGRLLALPAVGTEAA